MCSREFHTVKDMETGIPVVTAVDFMPPLNILYSSQTFIWISQMHKSPDSKQTQYCRHPASLKSVTYIYYKRVATGSLGHWVTGHRFRPGHGPVCCTTTAPIKGLISRFLSCTSTEVSGVENIGQCGRLSQLRWLLGAL